MKGRVTEAWTAFNAASGRWSASATLTYPDGGQMTVSGPAYRRMTPKGERMTLLFDHARKAGVQIGHRSS